MTAKVLKTEKGYDFSKKNKVSVWISTHPYQDIPDDYFEESFNKNRSRATNQWCQNYQLRFFKPELLETNGSLDGTIDLKRAAGECSFSESFIQPLLNKAKKSGVESVSWIILLYDTEYSVKLTEILNDEYTRFLGTFTFDDTAENVFDPE